jgi:hypothetical protein
VTKPQSLADPFLTRIMTFITYEEIYKETISYEGLIRLIESLPTIYWIRLASMGHMLLEHHPTRPNDLQAQSVMVQQFIPDSLRNIKVQSIGGRPRAMFHAPQFLALMRLALLHGHEVEFSEDDQKRRDITARCLLGISSFIYVSRNNEPEIDPKELRSKLTFDFKRNFQQQEKAFLMNLLQLYFNHLHEDFNNLVGRFKDMALDIPVESDFNPNNVSKDLLYDSIKRDLGLTPIEYSALTFGIIAKYFNTESIFKKENPFFIDPDVYFSTTSTRKELTERYFSAIIQSQSEFKVTQEENSDSLSSISNFKSFMLKPLVHLDDSKECYPTSLTYLQRLMESGLLWVVAGGEMQSDLRSYWGQVFEYYCHKICKRIETNSRIKPQYFRVLPYKVDGQNKESCDAIFVCNDKAVMVEFKIKFVNQKSILNSDFDSFVSDIDKLLIETDGKNKAAAQINDTIKAIRNSQLILPGVNAQKISVYYPLVVTLQSWPNGPGIYDVIRREIRKNKLLSFSSSIAPLEMWSVEEFEHIETLLCSEYIDLATFINHKLISSYKDLSCNLFLYDNFPDKYFPNKYLQGKTEEMSKIVTGTLNLKT